MRDFVGKFRRRYILTGTPMPQSYIDLFSQIYLLDQGNSLGFYITHYRNKYFYNPPKKPFDWVPFPGATKKIAKRIAPLVLRMSSKEYLQLPKKTNDVRWMVLPPEAREQYDEMEEEFLTIVENEIITAPSAAAAGMKCRQMLNGAVYTDAKRNEWSTLHDLKIEALKDLVEELSGQPLLVFYEFKHDRQRIEQALKWPVLTGASPKKIKQTIDLFNRGLLPGMVAHPATGGHGLNLQEACSHVCWFGLTWNFEYYDQAIKRVWRQGNPASRVVIHHLCVRDSLDEEVLGVLKRKKKTMAKFMRAINRLQ
jgi:SNF2 family DNA or RNA helicase